jgi:hypothetical protein
MKLSGEPQCVDSRPFSEYGTGMSDLQRNESVGQGESRQDTIAGFLASALNMEDQISSGAYDDYMSPGNWPAELDEKVFHEIRRRLTTLTRDTKRHREILQRLVREYGGDE